MHLSTVLAFRDELEKIAGHGIELAGLGMLAAPHAYNAVTGKSVSKKTERNAELAGLGTLAAPSLAHYGAKALKLVKKADFDMWNPSTGHVSGGTGGTRAANMGVSTAAKSVAKPKFTMDHLKGAYQKAGIKPGLKSALNVVKKAI